MTMQRVYDKITTTIEQWGEEHEVAIAVHDRIVISKMDLPNDWPVGQNKSEQMDDPLLYSGLWH